MDFPAMVCRTFVTSVLFLSSFSSYAAQQGNIGKSSSGSFSIRLVIQPNLQTSIATQSFTTTHHSTSTVANFNQPEPLCIKGTGINQYSVSAEGSGANDSFTLSNGQHSYNYKVDLWSSRQSSYDFQSGQRSDLINTAPRNSDCDESQTGFMIKLPEATAQQPLEGTLRFVISAE
jgi:hypothetical protein